MSIGVQSLAMMLTSLLPDILKCLCDEKIISPIQILVKHALPRNKLALRSWFSNILFRSKMFSFLKHANEVQSDVIYSRILNQI